METTINSAISASLAPAPSVRRARVSYALSGLGALFVAFDGVIKLVKSAPVVEAFAHLGYPETLARGLGTLECVLLALYLIPNTAILGAVLWTGYLGGAIATHLRVGDPMLSHTLFPIYVAALLWGGLYLRDERVRALTPFTSHR